MITINRKNPTEGEVTSSLTNAESGGLHFDGAAGYVDISSPPDLGTKFSFEFVLKADSIKASGWNYIVDFGNGGRFALASINGDLGLYDTGTRTFGVSVLNDLKVHHIVVTVDGTAAVLYDNANQVGTATLGANATIDSCTDATIAEGTDLAGNKFDGTFSRLRFYNRTLSASEVKEKFENQNIDFSEQWGNQTNKFSAAVDKNWGTNQSDTGNDANDRATFDAAYVWGMAGSPTDISVASNVLTFSTAGASNGIFYPSVLSAGKKFRATINVGSVTGSAAYKIQYYSGSAYVDVHTLTSGVNTVEFTPSATNGTIYILATSGTAGTLALNAASTVNSLVQSGCVSSYELQSANPTQSLMVQDSSGAADGTCSASGVSQINGITQVNAVSARIGSTGGPETPADGELIASKVNVTTSGNGEVIVGRDSGASILCQAQASSGRIGTSSNHELQFTANNTVYARIKNNGLFGVNQGAPVQKLHVTGNGSGSTAIDSHGYGLRVSDENHAHGAVDIVSSADTAQFIARSNVQGGFSFKSYASVGTSLVERLKIDASGNMYVASGKFGVGNAATSTPSHLLTVQDSGATGLAKIYSTTGTVTNGQKIVEIRADDDANPVAYDLLNVAQGDKERLVVTGEGDTTLTRWTAGNGTGANTVLTLAVDDQPAGTDMAAGDGTRLLFKIPAADTSKVGASIDAIRAVATDANSDTNLRFMVSQNDETLDTAMQISSSGHVSIGHASPQTNLDIQSTPLTVGQSGLTKDNCRQLGMVITPNGTGSNTVGDIYSGFALGDGFAGMYGYDDGSGSATGLGLFTGNGTTVAERLKIDSSGLATFSNGIAVNDTSGNYGGKIASSSDASGTASLSAVNKATSGTRRLIDFFAGTNTTRIGSIETDGSATAFNTSSDYRLKDNLEPLTGALDRIEQLPVYRFNFKSDPEKTVDGFVAHEVAEFVPEAISGTKDGMQTVVVQKAIEAQPATYWEEDDELPEGVAVGDEKTPAIEAQEEVTEEQPDYQGIDQSKLVPLLVAAVKELKAKVEALENA